MQPCHQASPLVTSALWESLPPLWPLKDFLGLLLVFLRGGAWISQ